MRIGSLFTDADLEAIREATAAAELRTGGEIVPYIVERVVSLDQGRWRGAALGALAAALTAGLAHALADLWGGWGVAWVTLPAIAGAGLGYLVGGLEPVARWLIPADEMERLVGLRAEAAFLREEVFKTRDRTGILIFLALFEHEAVILADEGINRVVPDGKWQSLVDELIAGIKAGRAAAALIATIGRCGGVLQEHKVELRPDDTDELPDRPRVRER